MSNQMLERDVCGGGTFNRGSLAAALSKPLRWTSNPCKAISCLLSRKGLILLKGESSNSKHLSKSVIPSAPFLPVRASDEFDNTSVSAPDDNPCTLCDDCALCDGCPL